MMIAMTNCQYRKQFYLNCQLQSLMQLIKIELEQALDDTFRNHTQRDRQKLP